MTALTKHPVLQAREEAPVTELLGGSIGGRLTAEDTGGELALLEMNLPAGYPGPPLHVHPGFDETFYVLAGTIAVRVGDEARDAGPGAVVHVPREVAHTFANRSGAAARMLVLTTPAGHERYFADLAALIERSGGLPSLEEQIALNEAHGTVVVR